MHIFDIILSGMALKHNDIILWGLPSYLLMFHLEETWKVMNWNRLHLHHYILFLKNDFSSVCITAECRYPQVPIVGSVNYSDIIWVVALLLIHSHSASVTEKKAKRSHDVHVKAWRVGSWFSLCALHMDNSDHCQHMKMCFSLHTPATASLLLLLYSFHRVKISATSINIKSSLLVMCSLITVDQER